jgi:hypothetical protein
MSRGEEKSGPGRLVGWLVFMLLAISAAGAFWFLKPFAAPPLEAILPQTVEPPASANDLQEITVLLNQRLAVNLGVPANAPQGRPDPFAVAPYRAPDRGRSLEELEEEEEREGAQVMGPVEGGFELSVRTTDRCWLEVWVDGVRITRTNVEGGTTLVWSAKREITVEQVGREWALEISLNGQPLGLAQDVAASLEEGKRTIETSPGPIEVTLGQRFESRVLVGLKFAMSG